MSASASASADNAAFVAAMDAVARELLGEPNKVPSSKHELRFGSHGSMSVNLRDGTWFDHEAVAGGGVLDLLRERKRLDKPNAIEWLRQHGHLDEKPRPGRQTNGTDATVSERGSRTSAGRQGRLHLEHGRHRAGAVPTA